MRHSKQGYVMRPFFFTALFFGTELSFKKQRVNKKLEDLSRVNQSGYTDLAQRTQAAPMTLN